MIDAYILDFEDVTADIRVITIQLPRDQGYAYHAGQYIELHTTGAPARYFSIANAPRNDKTIDLHIRNCGGVASHYLCTHLKQGEAVQVSPAQGQLKLNDNDNPKVFLAGGTGITPFLAMIDSMTHHPAMHLYWGMSHADDFYMRPLRNGLSVTYCTENYPVDAYLENPIEGADIYLSGPPAMVNDSRAKLLAAGVEPSNIYHDEFA